MERQRYTLTVAVFVLYPLKRQNKLAQYAGTAARRRDRIDHRYEELIYATCNERSFAAN